MPNKFICDILVNMYEILKRQQLSNDVVDLEIKAPDIANKVEAGQFIILRVESTGERIPLTVCDSDKENGSIRIVFQIIGASTLKLSAMKEGDCLSDLLGPLGKPTDLEGKKKVCLVGGGVGCAVVYATAKKLKRLGAEVHIVAGFRNKDIVILEDDLKSVCDKFVLMTDDGTAGDKGTVIVGLEKLLNEGNVYDEVISIGPLVMMKFLALYCKEHDIKVSVSMNPIMIDGTGMCGCCRVTVGGERKFACIDGPDFDGALVDFDEVMKRAKTYKEFELNAYNEAKEELGVA